MSDIFREVDEDLRRDQMQALAKKYGGVVVGIGLAIIVGTAGYKGWETWRRNAQQAATIDLLNSVEIASKDADGKVDALVAFAGRSQPGDLATLAKLDAASLLARKGKTDDAVAIYDAVAVSASSTVFREVAALLSILHQVDKGDTKLLTARLAPLSGETSPWRYTARELTALLALRDGDKERAKTLFRELSEDEGAPAGVRSRAADLAASYGQS